jgi:hypothetical protein
MNLTGANLSVQAIWDQLAAEKHAEAEKKRAAETAAKGERDKVHEAFLERDVPPDAIDKIATVVRRAIANGEKRALVLQFPSDWMPDQGRSITTQDPNWPKRLEGFAKRAFDFYENELAPRGFQLQAEIVDWPGGMPGDVGWFLSWRHPEEH